MGWSAGWSYSLARSNLFFQKSPEDIARIATHGVTPENLSQYGTAVVTEIWLRQSAPDQAGRYFVTGRSALCFSSIEAVCWLADQSSSVAGSVPGTFGQAALIALAGMGAAGWITRSRPRAAPRVPATPGR